jgi:hypothetical protein
MASREPVPLIVNVVWILSYAAVFFGVGLITGQWFAGVVAGCVVSFLAARLTAWWSARRAPGSGGR